MSKVKVKLNHAGIGKIMRSQEMKGLCAQEASERATVCGPGYEVDAFVAPTRAVANVYPGTHEAYTDNLKNNTLLKNLRRG